MNQREKSSFEYDLAEHFQIAKESAQAMAEVINHAWISRKKIHVHTVDNVVIYVYVSISLTEQKSLWKSTIMTFIN